MEDILLILLIVFLAKVFGEAIERAGFPSILGEISAGVVIGVIFLEPDSEVLSFFAELGAIFLLFTAGYKEVHITQLRSASMEALIPTITQMLFAFGFGFLLGLVFNFGLLQSIFMGVAFSPTSIGVVVKTLIDFDYLSSRPGTMMLTSAIFDDIIGIFLLSIVATMATYNQVPSGMQMFIIAAKLVGYMLIMIFLGLKVFPRLFTYVQKMHVKESILHSL